MKKLTDLQVGALMLLLAFVMGVAVGVAIG